MLGAGQVFAQSEPAFAASGATPQTIDAQYEAKFRGGRLKLSNPVSEQWLKSLPLIRKAYLDGTWGELAKLVIASDTNLDLAYFYLGRSAEGLGHASAAKVYYVRSRNAPNCVGQFEICHGYSPVSDLEPRLQIVTRLEAEVGGTSPQQLITLPSQLWGALSEQQRNQLEDRYVVDVISERNYGVILNVQQVNESTPGTTAGSQLGAAYASAAYVDRAFKGTPQNWNYSATGQLTSTLAGALIGSMLDKAPENRFHARYTIRSGNGDVGYLDSYSSDQFTHPAGMCVQINPLKPISAETCQLTLERILSYHFGIAVPTVPAKVEAVEARSVETRLKELKSIFDKGIITKDIFERKRDEILNSL